MTLSSGVRNRAFDGKSGMNVTNMMPQVMLIEPKIKKIYLPKLLQLKIDVGLAKNAYIHCCKPEVM